MDWSGAVLKRRSIEFRTTHVHGRSSFGAFVDKNFSVAPNGQKCLVLPSITYDELLGPVRG